MRTVLIVEDEIRTTVWGYSHFISLRDIDKAVDSLRSKVEPNPARPQFIHVIPNIGYKFQPPETHGNSAHS